MTLKTKLLLAFAFEALFLLVVGGASYLATTHMSSDLQELLNDDVASSARTDELQLKIDELRGYAKDILIFNKNQESVASNYTKFQKQLMDIRKLLNEQVIAFSKDQDLSKSSKDSIKTVEAFLLRYEESIKKIYNKTLTETNTPEVLSGLADRNAIESVENIISLSEQELDDITKRKSDSDVSFAKTMSMIIMIVVIVGLMLSITLGVLISNAISNPVKAVTDSLSEVVSGNNDIIIPDKCIKLTDEIGSLARKTQELIADQRNDSKSLATLASGDWTVKIKQRSEKDELHKALRSMIVQVNNILRQIREVSEQVAAGSTQIAATSDSLSRGNTEQAASIEQISASLSEISAQTTRNAESAKQASKVVGEAKKNAVVGANQMEEMEKSMTEISESSKKISQIIKTIDEIAFQTNLLALNAAVEAARAGKHGRSFSVVAEEVRNLAQRSAKAAKETEELINESVGKTEQGAKIAEQTSKSLKLIKESIEAADRLTNDIATASTEQALGVEQINQGMGQIANVTQQNSASAEEMSASAIQLSGQAETLKSSMEKFKL
jgi:methyl-accepting chemotaxis protein